MRRELERPIQLRYQHTPDNRQFQRQALEKSADRNWRNARHNAFADMSIG
jgi:hypothetical protein